MSTRPSLIQAERVDWAALRCGCGKTGAHLPETFARLLEACTPGEIAEATLEGHISVQSLLFERRADAAAGASFGPNTGIPPAFIREVTSKSTL